MNYWTEMSVKFANQKNYLDSLFKVYPMSPNIRREINPGKWREIKCAFDKQDNNRLVKELLNLELFPLKDSYVAYLKRDKTSIDRNPETISRIAGHLYEMGIDTIYEKCTEPKETNRQIGPLFKRWIDKGTLGLRVVKSVSDFMDYQGDGILNCSDAEMENFARTYLGYNHEKGLDFIARYNSIYVIGEAKFLTDFGGHQDAQFNDAISTITSELLPNKLGCQVVKIAICDGVLYIKNNQKMHRHLKNHDEQIVLSSLLLNDFIHSL